MRCSHCGKCCEETEMPLCKTDVKRLEKAGYTRKSFAHTDKRGFIRLRNVKGYCSFYDKTKHRCRAYKHRPLGCRVYPVIYSDVEGIIADDLCPRQATVTCREMKLKGKIVMRLLHEIDQEAEETFLLHKAGKQP